MKLCCGHICPYLSIAVNKIKCLDEWSMEDKVVFDQSFHSYGKQFPRIRQQVGIIMFLMYVITNAASTVSINKK